MPRPAPYLSQKLTRPLPTKDGGTLRTVAEARAYMLGLSKSRELRSQWQRAAELLLGEADVGALSKAVELALFYDAKLDPKWLTLRSMRPILRAAIPYVVVAVVFLFLFYLVLRWMPAYAGSAWKRQNVMAVTSQRLLIWNFSFQGERTVPILVRDGDRNVFIAECKIWSGSKKFLEAIDQLLGYLTWRDTKSAIIIFSRNKDFSAVIADIKDSVERHDHKKRGPVHEGQSRFRYIFGNPNDHNREIILTVMAFSVLPPSASAAAAASD